MLTAKNLTAVESTTKEVPMMEDSLLSRRRFMQTVLGGVAGATLLSRASSRVLSDGILPGEMPVRPLGRTGHTVRLFSLGGQATLETAGREEESLEIINRALDLGVNYIDTAAAYGQGVSEQYTGKVMATRRKEVFLATKTHRRSYDGSMRLLEQSLRHLQTDHLDLWQLHNVRTEEDLESIFAEDGAIRALERAREEKMVRFLGITGHRDPIVLRHGIERYPFDTILMALNAADRHHASFVEHLLPAATQRNLGIIGMKIPSRGRIFQDGGMTQMRDAMGYVLTLPVSTVIVGISTMEELEENVTIAREFTPLSPNEMARLEDLTRPYHAEANWFKASW